MSVWVSVGCVSLVIAFAIAAAAPELPLQPQKRRNYTVLQINLLFEGEFSFETSCTFLSWKALSCFGSCEVIDIWPEYRHPIAARK